MTRAKPDTRRPSIADAYQDLLGPLDARYRLSLIAQLAQGYYEGWRPTREQLAAVIAEDTRERDNGHHPPVDAALSVAGHAAVPATATPEGGPFEAADRNVGRASMPVISAFEVDCGEIATTATFVARSLSTNGMVKRGGELCRLVFLNYELRPVKGAVERPPSSPPTFTAPILCWPDRPVAWADGDGRDRFHTVSGNRVIARRGPWPLPATVQRVRFMISNEQGSPAYPDPPVAAGVLLVDIANGRAAWRPIPRHSAAV